MQPEASTSGSERTDVPTEDASGHHRQEHSDDRDLDRVLRSLPPPTSRQDVYDRCAPEVVDLLRCVDVKGATWFWACNHLHIELQKCYEMNKRRPQPVDFSKWDVTQLFKAQPRAVEQDDSVSRQAASPSSERWMWWLQDMKAAFFGPPQR